MSEQPRASVTVCVGSLHIKVLDLTDRTASELATAVMTAPEVASCLVAVVQLGVWAQQPEVQALSLVGDQSPERGAGTQRAADYHSGQ